ncbi:MAG: M2 family metallopeptidase [Kofleriaceae bacterium]
MTPRVLGPLALLVAACGPAKPGGGAAIPPPVAVPFAPDATPAVVVPPPPSAATAAQFIAEVDDRLRELWTVSALADWDRQTDLPPEHEARASAAGEAAMTYLTEAIGRAAAFAPFVGELSPIQQRQFQQLRLAGQPAPADPAQAAALAQVMTEMDGLYGTGKACEGTTCRNLDELSDVMAKSRDPKALLAAWQGWHDVGKTIAPAYERFVPLANAGAQGVGFADTGAMWRSRYDMPAEAMVAEADRLWGQVRPLYEQLHCYARRTLGKKYGAKVVPTKGPLPAHLLGNMWAQDWSNVYDLLEPYKGQPSPDVSDALVAQGYDATRMTKLAESFFTSLGMPALPATFWERSMLTRPEGKEVVCHASAWDPTYSGDARIKMCIKVNQEDLVTLHHELGHDYYYLAYHTLPVLLQDGANDGFHEAIGDTIALSITPSYLKQVGLLDQVASNDKALIDEQLFKALEKVAFLPFGLVVDKWRWEVFAGQVPRAQWNDRWWELRRQYQGVAPPVTRAADAFDPGAKYHVPGNTPYLRYFLSTILQFQFHRALCEAAGHQGPLHACSIFGSKAAGDRFWKMLQLGSSVPWPEALAQVTGGARGFDASAILDYFAPLQAWLTTQNKGKACGW